MTNQDNSKKNLRFLVDESSGKKLYEFLLSKGYDAKFVTFIMPGAPDEKVLDFAEKEKRILITNDKDFGFLIFKLNKLSRGVILLRLREDNPENRLKYLGYLLENFSHLLQGSFIVLNELKIRIRKKNE